jgi:hypothetical protein
MIIAYASITEKELEENVLMSIPIEAARVKKANVANATELMASSVGKKFKS